VVEQIGGDNYEFAVAIGGDRVGESRLSDAGSSAFSISWVYTYARHSVEMRVTIITIPSGAYYSYKYNNIILFRNTPLTIIIIYYYILQNNKILSVISECFGYLQSDSRCTHRVYSIRAIRAAFRNLFVLLFFVVPFCDESYYCCIERRYILNKKDDSFELQNSQQNVIYDAIKS